MTMTYDPTLYEQADQMGLGEAYIAELQRKGIATPPELTPATPAGSRTSLRPPLTMSASKPVVIGKAGLVKALKFTPTTSFHATDTPGVLGPTRTVTPSGQVNQLPGDATWGEALQYIDMGVAQPQDFGLGVPPPAPTYGPQLPDPRLNPLVQEMGLETQAQPVDPLTKLTIETYNYLKQQRDQQGSMARQYISDDELAKRAEEYARRSLAPVTTYANATPQQISELVRKYVNVEGWSEQQARDYIQAKLQGGENLENLNRDITQAGQRKFAMDPVINSALFTAAGGAAAAALRGGTYVAGQGIVPRAATGLLGKTANTIASIVGPNAGQSALRYAIQDTAANIGAQAGSNLGPKVGINPTVSTLLGGLVAGGLTGGRVSMPARSALTEGGEQAAESAAKNPTRWEVDVVQDITLPGRTKPEQITRTLTVTARTRAQAIAAVKSSGGIEGTIGDVRRLVTQPPTIPKDVTPKTALSSSAPVLPPPPKGKAPAASIRPGVVRESPGSVLARVNTNPDRVRIAEVDNALDQLGVVGIGSKTARINQLKRAMGGTRYTPAQIEDLKAELRQALTKPDVAPLSPKETAQQLTEGILPGTELPKSVLARYKAAPMAVQKGTIEAALRNLGIEDVTGTKAQLAAKLEDVLKARSTAPVSPDILGTRAPSPAAPPPIPPRKTSVAGGAGGFNRQLAQTNLPDDSQAIVRSFVQAQQKAGESITKTVTSLRRLQATITGDLPDQYLTTAARNEGQLRNAIVQNEVAKLKASWKAQKINLNSMDEVTRQEVLSDISNILQQTEDAVTAFRREITRTRYEGIASKDAFNVLLQRQARISAQVPNIADRAQNVLKEVVLGADLGVVLQQGLRAQRMGLTSEVSWGLGKATDRIRLALGASPESLGVYTDHTISPLAQAQADGLILTGGGAVGLASDVERAAQIGQNVGRVRQALSIPQKLVRGITDIQYRKLNDVRRIIYEGRLYQAKALGQDISPGSAVRRQIAEYANTAASTAYTATRPGRAIVEKRALLSPQLTRAQFAEMAVPLKTFSSPTRALNTANQVASVAATFGIIYALAETIGIPVTLEEFLKTTANPFSPNFGKITLSRKDEDGNNIVWNLLPQFSAENAILRSIRATRSAARGDTTARQALEDIGANLARYGFGRANIGVSDLMAAGGFGYGQGGKFYTAGNMPLGERLKSIAPVPLSTQNALIEGQTDPLAIAINILGGSTYPESPFSQRDRTVQEEVAGGTLPPTYKDANDQEQPLTSYEQLTKPQKEEFDARHAGQAARTEAKSSPAIQDIRREGGYYDDLQATQVDQMPFGQEWRDARSSLNDQKLGALDAIERQYPDYFAKLDANEATTLEDQALRDYIKAIEENTTNTITDWDAVDRVIAQWVPDKQQALIDYRLASGSTKEREYLQDVAKLEPYFQVQDQAWQSFASKNSAFSGYKTFDDYYDSVLEKAKAKNPNIAVPVLENAIENSLSAIIVYLSQSEVAYLAQHPGLTDLLVKHGFRVPNKAAGLASASAGR